MNMSGKSQTHSQQRKIAHLWYKSTHKEDIGKETKNLVILVQPSTLAIPNYPVISK